MRIVYTDYPITELGDKPNECAPIREFNLLSYDGDKYCWIKHIGSGIEIDVKSGYLYTDWDIYDESNLIPIGWLREVDCEIQ